MSINGKSSKKRFNRKAPLPHSATNSKIITRTSSPFDQQTKGLEQKVFELKSKLAKAKILIEKYESERKEQRKVQKEFIKSYHMRVISLQEEYGQGEDVEEKILKERNAIEDIWKRRYEEMRKMYEGKLKEVERSRGLCDRCKAFVKSSGQIEEKLKKLRRMESQG